MLFCLPLSWGRVCGAGGGVACRDPVVQHCMSLRAPLGSCFSMGFMTLWSPVFDWTLFPSFPSEVSRQWKTCFALSVMAFPHWLPFPCGFPTNLSPATLQVSNSQAFHPSACISSIEFLFPLLFPKTLTGSTSTNCSTPKTSHHCFTWHWNLKEILAQSGLPDLEIG